MTIRIQTQTHIHIPAHTPTHKHQHTHTHTYTHTNTHTHTHTHAHTHTHTHTKPLTSLLILNFGAKKIKSTAFLSTILMTNWKTTQVITGKQTNCDQMSKQSSWVWRNSTAYFFFVLLQCDSARESQIIIDLLYRCDCPHQNAFNLRSKWYSMMKVSETLIRS